MYIYWKRIVIDHCMKKIMNSDSLVNQASETRILTSTRETNEECDFPWF